MNRRSFLAAAPATAIAVSGCASLVTSDPHPTKNYKLHKVRDGLPTMKYGCKECEAIESVYIDVETLKTSSQPEIKRWREQVLELQGLPRIEQVTRVNTIVNRSVPYVADYKHWKAKDKWGFPVKSLTEGGDCEDIAILKLVSLWGLGWKDDSFLLLVGVSDVNGPKEGHAVALVALEDRSHLILDNTSDFVTPPSDARYFYPIYGVNEHGYYHIEVEKA